MYGIYVCKRILVIYKVDREICIICILLDSFGIYEVFIFVYIYLKVLFFFINYFCI